MIVNNLILNAFLIALLEMLDVKQSNKYVHCIPPKVNVLLLLRVFVFGVEQIVFYPLHLAQIFKEQTMQLAQHLDHFVIKLILVQFNQLSVHHMYVLIKQVLQDH